MEKKSLCITILILCFGLMVLGCPKKTVVRDTPSVKKEEPAVDRSKEQKPGEMQTSQPAPTPREKEFEQSLVAKKTPGIEGEVFESTLLKDIYFDYDKFDIRSRDVSILKENVAFLKNNPKMKIQVEGHCDERGTAEYNLALGERRANSAKKYLISLGLPGNRISTISFGKEKPLDPGHNEEAWSKNRRAHFVVLSK